jgi:hypothetical protein
MAQFLAKEPGKKPAKIMAGRKKTGKNDQGRTRLSRSALAALVGEGTSLGTDNTATG